MYKVLWKIYVDRPARRYEDDTKTSLVLGCRLHSSVSE